MAPVTANPETVQQQEYLTTKARIVNDDSKLDAPPSERKGANIHYAEGLLDRLKSLGPAHFQNKPSTSREPLVFYAENDEDTREHRQDYYETSSSNSSSSNNNNNNNNSKKSTPNNVNVQPHKLSNTLPSTVSPASSSSSTTTIPSNSQTQSSTTSSPRKLSPTNVDSKESQSIRPTPSTHDSPLSTSSSSTSTSSPKSTSTFSSSSSSALNNDRNSQKEDRRVKSLQDNLQSLERKLEQTLSRGFHGAADNGQQLSSESRGEFVSKACLRPQESLLSCLRNNPQQSLNCVEQVQAFQQCVDQVRKVNRQFALREEIA